MIDNNEQPDPGGTGKPDVFAKFAAELAAAGIDPATVFVVADECHGMTDSDVLEKMAELVRAGRDTRLDLRLDYRDLLQARTLTEIGGVGQGLREQLTQVTMGQLLRLAPAGGEGGS